LVSTSGFLPVKIPTTVKSQLLEPFFCVKMLLAIGT